ncbi:MAG: HEPN domain-containing protein [Acidobacteria bacterium]|nr:HEPN domain-containing protein [Acidobacteriota bacterium]
MPKRPRDLARVLLGRAELDLRSAKLLLEGDDLVDPVCFHIQQAAEKLLKALLSSAGITPRFTHDLGELLALAQVQCPALTEFSETLPFYTDFAVAARYDEVVLLSRREALEALKTVERLHVAVLATFL